MNRELWMNPQEAAVSLGISVKKLRRLDKAGKLYVARPAGNHRRIGMAEIQRLQRQGERAVRCALYARVSTCKQAQEGRLARQLERLWVAATEREYRVVQAIAQCASSLNEKRRGMKKFLSLVEQQAVVVVLLEYPDRPVRFGFFRKRYAYSTHAARRPSRCSSRSLSRKRGLPDGQSGA